MKTATIFDCEFLCAEGSQRRFWCGPQDPDPVVVQIGAVKLGLEGSFEIVDTQCLYVQPLDRSGKAQQPDPFFTRLTGVGEEILAREGQPLAQALDALDRFSEGARFWSWGKDELNMIAISCYIEGIAPPITADRFSNAVHLMVAANMPAEDIVKTPSSALSAYFQIGHPPLRAHDARDDALSLAYALQHLLRVGRLRAEDFER
ncbi:exonuclease [Rhizobium sp. CRIBSB]|nr:exonuclease [Rhizobium sp. CRIBSB]